jgi:hypothetical protein
MGDNEEENARVLIGHFPADAARMTSWTPSSRRCRLTSAVCWIAQTTSQTKPGVWGRNLGKGKASAAEDRRVCRSVVMNPRLGHLHLADRKRSWSTCRQMTVGYDVLGAGA